MDIFQKFESMGADPDSLQYGDCSTVSKLNIRKRYGKVGVRTHLGI